MSTHDTPKPKKSRKRKGRRARGSGAVFFSEARQRWIGRRVVGRTATGRTLYKEVWGKTQAEVMAKLADAGPPGPDVTIAAWAKRWLESVRVRTGTRAGYLNTLDKHALPSLGHLKVKDVTASRIEGFAARLGDDLEANTVRKVLSHLRTMFSSAVRDGLLVANPVTIAKKPRGKKKAIVPFTPGELLTIIERAGEFAAGGIIALMAGTGCRMGEALALDVEDFDRQAGTVHIRRTYHRVWGLGDQPKTENGVRKIRVPDPVVAYLVSAAGDRTTGPLFLTGAGRRPSHDLTTDPWHRLLKRLGLADRNPHQLRHSVATSLISEGVPLGDVARYLGDTVETLVKTYVHATGTDPADTLNRLLGGRKVGERSNRRKTA